MKKRIGIIVLMFVCLFTFVGCDKFMPIKSLEIPASDKYALSTYSMDDLDSEMVTLRADTMYVTQRNVPRAKTVLMSDEFILPNFSTGDLTKAKVNFSSYPRKPGHTKRNNFEKYMLLRQGMWLNANAEKMAENGTLQKHPGMDYIYGAVSGTDNAVIKEITIDPSYRSKHFSGLYLPAGEIITVKVENLKEGEYIQISTHLQNTLGYSSGLPADYFSKTDKYIVDNYASIVSNPDSDEVRKNIPLSGQYDRQDGILPFMTKTFKFSENKEYKIGTPFGGGMHINVQGTKSAVKLTISGAVETPHYILGVTTPEYFETYLRNAPGLISCLDTENGQLIGPSEQMRKVDDIENLALIWHSFFSVNESYTGGRHDAANFLVFDHHVPAGAAVALGGGVFAHPISMYNNCMNYKKLVTSGAWGPLHELGHGHGNAYGQVWGFNGNQEGEVRNNALIVLCYIKLCNMDPRFNSIEHGSVTHPQTNLIESLKNLERGKKDFNELGYFEALPMYVNLMHSFGADKFYQLLLTYSENPRFVENIKGKETETKRADFIYRASNVYGVDLRWYCNTMFLANVSDEYFSAVQLSELNSYPTYYPIANYYSNGQNGIKTAGEFKIPYGSEYVFKIAENFTAPKVNGSEIYTLSKVEKPKYGKINDNKDGTYTYIQDNNFRETDSFDIVVKMQNGYLLKLNVFLRIDYSLYEGEMKDTVNNFGFKQKYMLSHKNKLSGGSISSQKSEWKVLSVPNHEGGNTYKKVIHTDENGVNTYMEMPYSDLLIDENVETFYHSQYTGSGLGVTPMPHEYVFDTALNQSFNYFKINTRSNVNSFIFEYELYISDDNKVYNLIEKGEKLKYTGTAATISFKETVGRYFKLRVKSASGGKFSVISEINAGLTSQIQQIAAVTSKKLYTKNFVNSRDIPSLPNGLIVSDNKSKAVIRFKGDKIAIYGMLSPQFGSARVKIDGKWVGEINEKSDEIKDRQLVFYSENLKNSVHTVEIITDKKEKINLSFLGLSYGAELMNAPNIYKENALIISLVVICLLFAVCVAFIVLLMVNKKFKTFIMVTIPSKFNKISKKPKENKPKKEAPKKTTPTLKSETAVKITPAPKSETAVKTIPLPKSETAVKTTPRYKNETPVKTVPIPVSAPIVKAVSGKSETPSKPAPSTPKSVSPIKSSANQPKAIPQNTTQSKETTPNSKKPTVNKK